MKKNSYYLKALVEGESKCIQEVYQRLFPKVKKFIIQNNGYFQDAEDIFQRAFLQLAVRYKEDKFEIKTTFDAYFFTVCKNLWRRELNKSKNKVTNTEVFELKSDETDNAMALLEQKRWELFNEKLEEMSENCKKILALFFAKTSYARMVTVMNYNSEIVARQRVFKCKRKLKDLILRDTRLNALREL